MIAWTAENYAVNADANALRWGTLYSFRFNAELPPAALTQIEFGLFKPGAPRF